MESPQNRLSHRWPHAKGGGSPSRFDELSWVAQRYAHFETFASNAGARSTLVQNGSFGKVEFGRIAKTNN